MRSHYCHLDERLYSREGICGGKGVAQANTSQNIRPYVHTIAKCVAKCYIAS
jgi:hypothetical protein